MQTVYNKYNFLSTTISSDILAGTTTIPCSSLSGYSGTIKLVISGTDSVKREIITGTVSGNNLTSCARGLEGTTAQSHSSGDPIECTITAADFNDMNTNVLATYNGVIEFVIDGGGAAISTGIKGDITIPFACTINSVTLLADQTGSCVIDIWKDTYANFPPTVADTITASAKPTLSSAVKYTDSTLTGWTKTIAAGDVLRFNVNSLSTITRLTVSLSITKS